MLEIFYLSIPFVVGFLLARYFKQAEKLKIWLNNYLIYFGLPLFIFSALLASKEISLSSMLIFSFIVAGVIALIVFLLVKVIPLKDVKRKAVIYLIGSAPNTGYLGIPFCFLLFGSAGAALAAVYSVMSGVIHFGPSIFWANSFTESKEVSLKESLRFPLFWSTIIALALSQLPIVLPESVTLFALSAVYLALLIIGMEAKFTALDKDFLKAGLLRFLVSPLTALALIFFLPLNALAFSVILVQSLMPPALNNTIFALKFGFDSRFAAEFTSFATVLFLIVVGIIAFFFF